MALSLVKSGSVLALLITVLGLLAAWLQEQERVRVEQVRAIQQMRQNFQRRPHYVGPPPSMDWKQP